MTVFLFERSERPTPLAQIEALGLSPREAEVLRRFMRGETTAEAAQSLSISPRTIHKHADGIYRKLGVTDRVARSAPRGRRSTLGDRATDTRQGSGCQSGYRSGTRLWVMRRMSRPSARMV